MKKPSFAVIVLLHIACAALYAQNFGKNKIQYEDFNFQELHTEHFTVFYYEREKEIAYDSAQILERWYAFYSELLDVKFETRQPVILYADNPDFTQTNVITGLIPPGVGGVTESLANRMVIPLTPNYSDNEHVLGHELVHAFYFRMLQKIGRGAGGVPLWFAEGLAEYLSLGNNHPLTATWLRDAVIAEDFPTLAQMTEDTRYFPYRFGHAFWAYITGKNNPSMIKEFIGNVIRHGWQQGIKETWNISAEDLSKQWKEDIETYYKPLIQDKIPDKGPAVAFPLPEADSVYAPSISPDGKYLVYIAVSRSFTLDLFLADAQTGRVIRTLASSFTSEHFDSLRFISSSGAWNPAGDEFAFITTQKGDNHINIVNVLKNETTADIALQGVQAISDLAWSPDGLTLAIAGTSNGIGDLYLYDLKTQSLKQLTSDIYADLQPAWSPDGGELAFVTNRGDRSSPDALHFGEMRIGFYHLDTEKISLLPLFPNAKQINPRYSADGKELYFIADPDGFSNIYRYSLAENRVYKLTDIATGVTGLSEISPVMSLAPRTGQMVFTVFHNRQYRLYTFFTGPVTGLVYGPDGRPLTRINTTNLSPFTLPGQGLALPQDFSVSTASFSSKPYSPTLDQISLGVLSGGIALSGAGEFLAVAQASFWLEDFLGNHSVFTILELSSDLKSSGALVFYKNLEHRVNWGIEVEHFPYYNIKQISADQYEQDVYYRDGIQIIMYYPFSINRRLELSASYALQYYDAEALLLTYEDGLLSDSRIIGITPPPTLHLATITTAYVGDYVVWGFTSPIDGTRFRFEFEPTFGSLNFITLTADLRVYFFWKPVTLAFRILHKGRYIQDAESRLIEPYFLGNENYVRGYSGLAYITGDCPMCDNISGSSIEVGNVELRLPVLGSEELGIINFPYVPTELVVFFDAGLAWRRNEPPVFKLAEDTSERVPIFSTGAALRINFGNILILQFYYAYPFQRPGSTGVFGFFIAPGW
jgi:Tol biopolymer transport system component